jgi:malonyl-CoA O-methyltransferase
MRWLLRRQSADGGFHGREPARGTWPGAGSVGAVVEFLGAALTQVRTAFASDGTDVLDRLDPLDGRLAALTSRMATLPAGSIVADVGCGRGRYLNSLATAFPDYRYLGIDPSASFLASLAGRVASLTGGLLGLPLQDGSVGAAFAVESIEHSLWPERAVSELCRVVRPGGRVLIIDKDRRRQRLSQHQPWEIWLDRRETAEWLARACHSVEVHEVSHGPSGEFGGLFLLWEGIKR